MVKCECGHESCFHRGKASMIAEWKGQVPKTCAVKDCYCVRFTPLEDK